MIIDRFFNSLMELLGSFLLVAIIVTAFGLILGMVKPTGACRRIGVIVGAVIALLVVLRIAASAWSAMTLWQQMAIAALGLLIGITSFELFRSGKGNR